MTNSMPNRRRFSRGCPAMARRSSNVSLSRAARDDYTTTLNALTVSVIAPNQIHIAVKDDPPPPPSTMKSCSQPPDFEEHALEVLAPSVSLSDDEDDDTAPLSSSSRPFIRRRSPGTIEYHHQGYVTSLSFEGKERDHRQLPGGIPKLIDEKPKAGTFPLQEEKDDDVSWSESSTEEEEEEEEEEHDETSEKFVDARSTLAEADDKTTASCANSASSTSSPSFLAFRLNYLIVTVAIMLADGLQGTHLYVLYEGYGYSVASLYCLGFVTGAVTMPITGPLVDRFGRKKSALIYCALEIFINMLEQFPFLSGLIASRMIGGVTTNLLSSVFETWLDTEYRRQGFDQEKYEIVMRDSVVVGNLAAIASGYFAHELAERRGLEGPFEGAVGFTMLAFVVVMAMWTENYGSVQGVKSVKSYLSDAVTSFRADSKLLRVGIIQGCTTGSVQIFIFLWSPALRQLAKNAPLSTFGLDGQGEPAYGLIFGAFMCAGVLGGCIAPFVRRAVTLLLSPLGRTAEDTIEIEGEGKVRPMAVEFLAAFCYIACAALLLTPCLVSSDGEASFSLSLLAFLLFELIIGVYMPCEGVIRSLYIPSSARCSLLTLPRIIVNIAVAMGVISTNIVSLTTAFYAVSFLMVFAAVLQLSLVSKREWASLFGRVDRLKKRAVRSMSLRSMSFSASETSISGSDDESRRARILKRTKSSPPKVLSERLSGIVFGEPTSSSDDYDSFEKKRQ